MTPIDIHQLPIPEWDLACPRCGYSLNGLPSHRCAECGERLDMEAIIPTHARLRAPELTGTELPVPDFGLLCDSCDAALAGAQQWRCPACGKPFDPLSLRPAGEWIALTDCVELELPTPVITARLADECIPFVVSGRDQVRDLYGLTSVGGQAGAVESIYIAADFYFDLLALARNWRGGPGDDAASPALEWTCAQCGESNPKHFELCWNCESAQEVD